MGITLTFEVRFVLLALAVYRLAEMLAFDDGPLNLFWRLRAATGMYDRDANGSPYADASHAQKQLGALLECPYCAGVWFAFPATLILLFVPFALEGLGFIWLAVIWLALAGLQSALETFAGRGGNGNGV